MGWWEPSAFGHPHVALLHHQPVLSCCLCCHAERVGSFHVRTDDGQTTREENSDVLRQWIDQAINVDVPWMSPLVPWQPPLQQAGPPAPPAAAAAAEGTTEAQPRRRQREAQQRRLLEEEVAEGSSSNGKQKAAEAQTGGQDVEKRQEAGADGESWWKYAPAPPPPPPVGAHAVALLHELNLASPGSDPRHVCIQGKLENSRRNYSAAFEALG